MNINPEKSKLCLTAKGAASTLMFAVCLTIQTLFCQANTSAPPPVQSKRIVLIGSLQGSGEGDCVAFSKDAKILACAYSPETSGCTQSLIILRNIRTGRTLHVLHPDVWAVNCMEFSPDGIILAVAGEGDDPVSLWSIRTGKKSLTLKTPETRVSSLIFSPDGKSIVDGGHYGLLEVWDTKSGRFIHRIDIIYQIFDMALSPNGKLLAVALIHKTPDPAFKIADDPFGEIRLYSVPGYKLKRTIEKKNRIPYQQDSADSLAYAQSGNILASRSDYSLQLWDPDSGKLLKTLVRYRMMSAYYSYISFLKNGRLFAALSYDWNTIQIWDTRSWQHLYTIKEKSQIQGIASSPAGSLVATIDKAGAVMIWKID